MNILYKCFILFLSIHSISLFGQLGDCSGAQLVEMKSDIPFKFLAIENQTNDILTPLCEGAENPFIEDDILLTQWFTWTIESTGDLFFSIYQFEENYDLDFILYKSDTSENACEDKEAIRCMYSGPTFMGGELTDECSSITGLNALEDDVYENPGCNDNSNNFLMYIDAIAGEVYHLVVIDFSNLDASEAEISFCGSAILGPDDSPCYVLDTDKTQIDHHYSIYQNPVKSKLIIAQNSIPTSINFPYIITNQIGEVVLRNNNKSFSESIEISSLSPGIHFIHIFNEDKSKVMKFIKY